MEGGFNAPKCSERSAPRLLSHPRCARGIVRCVSLAFISHPECHLHEMGEGHPERPERLRVHDPEYVDALAQLSPPAGLVQLDPDTAMNQHTFAAALHAAGAGVLG